MIRSEISCFRPQSGTGENPFLNNRPFKDLSNIEIILYENSLRLIRRVNEDFEENESGFTFNSYSPLNSIFLFTDKFSPLQIRS